MPYRPPDVEGLFSSAISADENPTMRSGLRIGLVVLGLSIGCGRIGYGPLSTGAAGATGTGVGGSGAGGASGGAGTTGTGGGAGGMAGTTGRGGAGGGAGGIDAGAAGAGGLVDASLVDAGPPCALAAFNGHDYEFCNGPVAWSDAENDCAAKGMRLVRIDDVSENTWVQATAFAGVASTSSVYWPWIGATDLALTGAWRWTDGALFWMGGSNGTAPGGLYNNWVAGSPTSGGAATDCAILQSAAYWTDFDCTRLQPYVCERY
jgi:hypothetical protein